jgi:hypothetical protein
MGVTILALIGVHGRERMVRRSGGNGKVEKLANLDPSEIFVMCSCLFGLRGHHYPSIYLLLPWAGLKAVLRGSLDAHEVDHALMYPPAHD